MNFPRGALHPQRAVRRTATGCAYPQLSHGRPPPADDHRGAAFAADATLELVADTASGPLGCPSISSKRCGWTVPAGLMAPRPRPISPRTAPILWFRLRPEAREGRDPHPSPCLPWRSPRSVRRLVLHQVVHCLVSAGAWRIGHPALFDLTFTSPDGFPARLRRRAQRFHRRPRPHGTNAVEDAAPIRNASFNLGLFERYDIEVTARRLLRCCGPKTCTSGSSSMMRQGWPTSCSRGKNMKEQVGRTVDRDPVLYPRVRPAAEFKHFYATEIPYFHGEAWPGVIGLSWVTFQQTREEGFDQVFRAHEVGHQWWGIGVDYATYHDRWMSEGFSDFAGSLVSADSPARATTSTSIS